MMSTLWKGLKAFGGFWYSFIIGDDWLGAAGVAFMIGGGWVLLRLIDIRAFWFGPIVIVSTAVLAVRRGLLRNARQGGG